MIANTNMIHKNQSTFYRFQNLSEDMPWDDYQWHQRIDATDEEDSTSAAEGFP